MNLELPKTIEEFAKLIVATPSEDKRGVEDYHSRLIQLLDYSGVFEVPSFLHRMLHQQIWVSAFQIYNGYPNFTDASINFVREGSRGGSEEFKTQRNRFNFWYEQEYLLPFEREGNDWAKSVVESDEELSREVFGVPLKDVYVDTS
jgi:hypothetical protein